MGSRYRGPVSARVRCRFCGGAIVLTADGAPPGVTALADQIFHQGCVETHAEKNGVTTPAYLLPDDV